MSIRLNFCLSVPPELLRSFFEDTDQNDRDCNVENYSGQHGKYSYVMRRRRKIRMMTI